MHSRTLGIALCLAFAGTAAAQSATDASNPYPQQRPTPRTVPDQVQAPVRAVLPQVDDGQPHLASQAPPGARVQPAPLPVLLPSGGQFSGAAPVGAPFHLGTLAPGCTAGEVYDDGVAESGLGLCGAPNTVVVLNQFTPPGYPYAYDQVCVSFTQTAGDDALDFELVMYDDDGVGGGPGTFLGSIAVSASSIPAFPAVSPFFDYAVSFPAVSSGSVWIGGRWDAAVEDCFFFSGDSNSNHPDYWSMDGGLSFSLDEGGSQALLVRAEGDVVACSEGEVYDDGSGENGVSGVGGTDDVIVSLFTPPSSPYQYDELCISWTQNGGNTSLDFDLVFYDDDGANGEPGTLLASFPATVANVPAFPEIGEFMTYSIPGGPLFLDGNVYIGAAWDEAANPGFFVSADDSGNHPDYNSGDGGLTWGLDNGGFILNAMIRANGEDFCAGGEVYDDGSVENGWGNSFTYIQVSQFTPASYPFTYDEVCLGWTQTAVSGGTTDLDYTLVIYDDDGAAGAPGTRLAQVDVSVDGIADFFSTTNYSMFTHTLDCAPEVTSGSVWIGVEWDGISQPERFLAIDDSVDHPDYTDQNGGGFELDQPGFGTYMVRAGFSGEGANPTASATIRNAGTNPLSFTADAPVLGQTVNMTVDLNTTGHSLAGIVGFLSPLEFTLGAGQTLLVNVADPGAEVLGLPILPGPVANFSLTATIDLSACGLPVYAQAVHIGGVQPFALSNAVDWIVGR